MILIIIGVECKAGAFLLNIKVCNTQKPGPVSAHRNVLILFAIRMIT
jgi:hypothetical protein